MSSSPVLAFQTAANAALKSWYSSRVGSYDTLSIDTFFAATGVTAAAAVNATARTSCLRNEPCMVILRNERSRRGTYDENGRHGRRREQAPHQTSERGRGIQI